MDFSSIIKLDEESKRVIAKGLMAYKEELKTTLDWSIKDDEEYALVEIEAIEKLAKELDLDVDLNFEFETWEANKLRHLKLAKYGIKRFCGDT